MKPKNSPTPDQFKLTIDSLSYSGGRGVGRYQGVVVFVPGTAPGDLVRVRVTQRKPRFLQAEILEILQAGPQRRQPPCKVAGRCGGCSWQHVSYDEQIVQKEKILRDSLRRLGGYRELPFLRAPQEFHYRNRIQLQIQNGRRGFFVKGTRDLVEFDHCWISEEPINQRLRTLTPAEIGDARKLELALDESDQIHLSRGERDPEAALFSQVNRVQNEALKAQLLAQIRDTPDWIYDLYCGAGNLTLPLARKFAEVPVTAIELSQASIARAQKLESRVRWRAGDVARELVKIIAPSPGRGLIVLDPPRTGADAEVIAQLVRLRPSQIFYVSCNPATFARDAERLHPHFGLESVQGLDMFPQTEHVELIASFTRKT